MKLTENINGEENRLGQLPGFYVTGADATPQHIFDALWGKMGGQGYKFAVIFDVSHDEYEDPPKETPVYYLDDLLVEAMVYAGRDRVLTELKEMGWIK